MLARFRRGSKKPVKQFLDVAMARKTQQEPTPEQIDEAACHAKVQQLAAEWREKWPQHCKACHGWGGSSYTQSHPYGMGSAHETLFDPCEATERPETCHRCGVDGLDGDGNGPCKHCGWNYDDGDPEHGG